MAFTNRVRLPIKLSKPQYIEESDEYRKANGETVVLSVVIRKVYDGITDYLPEKLHERFKIALRHDTVIIEGQKYAGAITQEGSYDIEWPEFKDYPLAQAKFKANVTPFNASNSNCGTCEEFTQVVCEDDHLGTLNEGSVTNFDPLDNDSICCNPVNITLVTTNSTYVDSLVIEPDNTMTLTLKTPLSDANGVILATYRAECDNGQFDEANIIADITGSDPVVCLAPTDLQIIGITTNYAQATWVAPVPAPDGYDWELYELDDLGTPVLTGQTSGDLYADLDSLSQDTEYRFFVRSLCGVDMSNFIFIDFTTLPDEAAEFCGSYRLFNGSGLPRPASWIDCSGETQNALIPPFTPRDICAMQTSPGVPVDITVTPSTTVTYQGLC